MNSTLEEARSRYFFVKETRQPESVEESEKKILTALHDELGVRHIGSEDIEAAHRVGERKDAGTRQIIAKFVSRETKAKVIRNRKKAEKL